MVDPNILIIDDRIENSKKLKSSLQSASSKKGVSYNFLAWTQNDINNESDKHRDIDDTLSNATEDIWSRILGSIDDLAMVVVDRDLSGINSPHASESSIINACLQQSIPVCTYHRKPSKYTEASLLGHIIRQSNSFSIKIDIDDIETAAYKIIDLSEGFREISKKVQSVSLDEENLSPAKILAQALGMPALSLSLSQYAHSTSLAAFIMNMDELQEEDFGEQVLSSSSYKKRLSFVLGCWLHNHIINFPGIILNDTAARSYINLNKESFENYAEAFKGCIYKGPFSSSQRFWWRHKLDEMLDDCSDALEYLDKAGEDMSNTGPCRCNEDPSVNAGFYCIITRQPISLEMSEGRLSWIPSGADLCRVSSKKYRSIAPLMGL